MPLARALSRISGRTSVPYIAATSLVLSLGCGDWNLTGLPDPNAKPIAHPSLDGAWEAQTTITCAEAPTSRPGTMRVVLTNDGPLVSDTETGSVVQRLTGTWQATQCSGGLAAAIPIFNGEYGQSRSLNSIRFEVDLVKPDPVTGAYDHVLFLGGGSDTLTAATMPGLILRNGRRSFRDSGVWDSATQVAFTRQP